jgi:hypothetical protein
MANRDVRWLLMGLGACGDRGGDAPADANVTVQ